MMMENNAGHSEITYVLFGKEAVKLYRLSLKTLLNSLDVEFRVGAYSSVKKFVSDTKEWNDFIEISKEDFLSLRSLSSEKTKRKKTKQSFLSKIFK